MRAARVLLALAMTASAALPAQAQTTARAIDAIRSKALLSVAHVYVERVTGSIPIASGKVVLPEGSAIPLSVTAVLDPSAIKTGDDDRDAALVGPDWFDVKRFPTWTFTSTKIVASSPTAFTMDGLLTVHGVTRSEHLDVTVAGTFARPVYNATGKIDRHAFGMTVTRLDPVIGNPVDVTLDVTLSPLHLTEATSATANPQSAPPPTSAGSGTFHFEYSTTRAAASTIKPKPS